MSDKQMQALQKLLECSSPEKNSDALDTQILLAAQIQSELHKQRKPLLNYLLTPLGTVGNVLASAVVTAFVFVSMAMLISQPEPHAVFADSAYADLASHSVLGGAVQPSRSRLSTLTSPKKRPYSVQYSADEVLLELSLPSVTDLIKSMQFVAEDHRSAATIELISALADIDALIGVGELDEARVRYLDLRDRCYACQLPRTLEALALNNIHDPDSG